MNIIYNLYYCSFVKFGKIKEKLLFVLNVKF